MPTSKQQRNMVKSRYRLATVRRWSCSDTIDIDSEANPERAKRGAGTIGQAVKTLLAAYQSFSELVRVEKPPCPTQI